MTCTFDRELLALLMNGDLSLEERHTAAVHLSECDECQGIMAQYRAGADELAGSLPDVRPALAPIRRAAPRWGRAVAAAVATVLLLVGVMQVPAVAAGVSKVFPFLQLFEMDKKALAAFLWGYNHDTFGKPIYPDLFETVAAAEEAWGGPIPQPAPLPDGMERTRISMFRSKSGEKDVSFYYANSTHGANLAVQLSTRPQQQRRVPKGATSVTMVNGQEAVVIRGTFSQYPGKPLTWDPDSDIHLIFPFHGLSADVSTVGNPPGMTTADLVKIAESIR